MSVVNPMMVDYETDQQFYLIITATDTVMPMNERRGVSKLIHYNFLFELIRVTGAKKHNLSHKFCLLF